jgi:hypothetical protein
MASRPPLQPCCTRRARHADCILGRSNELLHARHEASPVGGAQDRFLLTTTAYSTEEIKQNKSKQLKYLTGSTFQIPFISPFMQVAIIIYNKSIYIAPAAPLHLLVPTHSSYYK